MRSHGMDHEARLWRLARVLIAKHGKAAPAVAHERAQDRLAKRDYRVASMWAHIADVVSRMSTTGARRIRSKVLAEPSLPDILDGGVTKAMMEADNVDRKHVEAVMDEAKQKREHN
jgi:hypothetical protein